VRTCVVFVLFDWMTSACNGSDARAFSITEMAISTRSCATKSFIMAAGIRPVKIQPQ
jgi:hypothetical protein